MAKQRVTVRDVAVSANVSASAVSLVLNDRPGVSAETRERVWRAISALGYASKPAGEQEKPQSVGLLIEKTTLPVILDIFYGEVLGGFQSEAQRLGMQVTLHMFDRDGESLELLLGTLTGTVSGLVIANDGDITPAMMLAIRATELPVLLIESYIPDQQFPCVLGDNFTAGYTTMRHLLDLGHREIAILPGPDKYSSLLDRVRGALAASAEAGILIPSAWMPAPPISHPKKGYVQMKTILAGPQLPTAVFAVSDKTAFGALEAIKEAGLRVPADIAIASIDDVAESAYTSPALTTFRIPKYQMGVLAMHKLNRLISGEPELAVKSIVYGELVVRESSAAPHQR